VYEEKLETEDDFFEPVKDDTAVQMNTGGRCVCPYVCVRFFFLSVFSCVRTYASLSTFRVPFLFEEVMRDSRCWTQE